MNEKTKEQTNEGINGSTKKQKKGKKQARVAVVFTAIVVFLLISLKLSSSLLLVSLLLKCSFQLYVSMFPEVLFAVSQHEPKQAGLKTQILLIEHSQVKRQ